MTNSEPGGGHGPAVTSIVVLLLSLAWPTLGQAAGANANASATIVTSAEVADTTDVKLEWRAHEPIGAYRVAVGPDGSITCRAETDCPGLPLPGQAVVRGEPFGAFSIDLGGARKISFGTGSMMVDRLISSPRWSGVLGADGKAKLLFGMTVDVGAEQPRGHYVGHFDVLIDYQ